MKKALLLLAVLPLMLCCSCAANSAVTAAGFYFDTAVTVTAWGVSAEEAQAALDTCGEWEALLSKTRRDSDVWSINSAGGAKTPADVSTVELIELSREVSELSGGAFDITIDVCSRLWDFKNGVMPDAEQLKAAVAAVDYRKIETAQGSVTLSEGMSIDLGGVAKGYIADRLAELLEQKGASAALVNAGGDIAVKGKKPDGSEWSIGIRDPQGGQSDVLARVKTEDGAVVTSGTYERCFTVDGASYHHIIDPATGMSACSGLVSATVICESAAKADALSTACIVMGAERAAEMIEGIEDTEAVFIKEDMSIVCTEGAKEMLSYE